MAINLGSAYGKVSIDVSGVRRGVDSAKKSVLELSEMGMNIGNSMRNIGLAMTAAFTLPTALLGKSAVKAASAMDETKNKVKVIFGEMSEDIMQWSKNSASAFGQSQQQALDAAATFGNLFTTMKLGKQEASEMSMKLVELASDLASFHDLEPEVALEKLRAGLVGEAEPLRALGIQLSEAQVIAKALQVGLVDVAVNMVDVNGAALDLEEAQLAVNDAMGGGVVDIDKLSSAQDRLASASNRVADAENRLSTARTKAARAQRDLEALIAKSKTDKVDPLSITRAQERVADALERVTQAEKKLAEAKGKTADAQQKVISASVPEYTSAMDIAQAKQTVTEREMALQKALAGTNVELTESQKLQARYLLILEQSANAQGDFGNTSESFANRLRSLNATWQNTLVIIGNLFLPLATKVLEVLTKMLEKFNQLTPFQQKMVVGFVLIVAAIGPLLVVMGTLITLLSKVAGALSLVSQLGITLPAIGTTVTTTLVPAFSSLAATLWGSVVPAVGALGAGLAAAAVPILIIAALLVGLALTVGVVMLAWRNNWFHFRDIVQTALANVRSLFASFKATLRGDTDEAAGILQEMFERVMGLFEKLFGEDITAKFRETLTGFITFLSSALGRIRDYIARAFQGTNWAMLGRAILYGIAGGMLAGLPSLLATATNVATAVLNQIKRSLGIASPSKAFMQLGVYSAQGYQLGLARAMSAEDVSRNITKPVNQLMNSTQQTVINNFSGGLTTREVQSMINVNIEDLVYKMTRAMGGA